MLAPGCMRLKREYEGCEELTVLVLPLRQVLKMSVNEVRHYLIVLAAFTMHFRVF